MSFGFVDHLLSGAILLIIEKMNSHIAAQKIVDICQDKSVQLGEERR